MTAQADTQQNEERWTVRRVLDWTTDHLRSRGSESPRLDAEILLAHARGCDRVHLYTQYNEELTAPQRGTMRELVKKRAERVPVAYLVGKREFFSLTFEVTPDVLIPRPETETLVVELIASARKVDKPRILDVGTGSGCIAVAAAVNLPSAHVTAVDISEAALAVAKKNAEMHRVAERIDFRNGDLFASIPTGEQFGFIVSNPPYVTDTEINELPEDVRLHEPHSALQAGGDGLDVIRRLVSAAPAYLKPGGELMIEVDPAQSTAVQKLVAEAGRYKTGRAVMDLSRNERVVIATV